MSLAVVVRRRKAVSTTASFFFQFAPKTCVFGSPPTVKSWKSMLKCYPPGPQGTQPFLASHWKQRGRTAGDGDPDPLQHGKGDLLARSCWWDKGPQLLYGE